MREQVLAYYGQERVAAKELDDDALIRAAVEALQGSPDAATVARERALYNEIRVRARSR